MIRQIKEKPYNQSIKEIGLNVISDILYISLHYCYNTRETKDWEEAHCDCILEFFAMSQPVALSHSVVIKPDKIAWTCKVWISTSFKSYNLNLADEADLLPSLLAMKGNPTVKQFVLWSLAVFSLFLWEGSGCGLRWQWGVIVREFTMVFNRRRILISLSHTYRTTIRLCCLQHRFGYELKQTLITFSSQQKM